jgi:hypothetical protein
MAQTVCILLGEEDRRRLAAILGDRNRPQKHVQRARIVLLSADRLPVLAVARRAEASRPAVWRWQQRFAEEGIEGLLRDAWWGLRSPHTRETDAGRSRRRQSGEEPSRSDSCRSPKSGYIHRLSSYESVF